MREPLAITVDDDHLRHLQDRRALVAHQVKVDHVIVDVQLGGLWWQASIPGSPDEQRQAGQG